MEAVKKSSAITTVWQGIPVGVKVLGFAVLAFIAYKKVKKAITEAQAAKLARDQAAAIAGEAAGWASAGDKLSFPLSQYSAMADKLEVAMDGPWYDPTDEKAVKDVLNQLLTNSDFLQLGKAFGVREDWTLQQWISGDFGPAEISDLNKILTTKNIIYAF